MLAFLSHLSCLCEFVFHINYLCPEKEFNTGLTYINTYDFNICMKPSIYIYMHDYVYIMILLYMLYN